MSQNVHHFEPILIWSNQIWAILVMPVQIHHWQILDDFWQDLPMRGCVERGFPDFFGLRSLGRSHRKYEFRSQEVIKVRIFSLHKVRENCHFLNNPHPYVPICNTDYWHMITGSQILYSLNPYGKSRQMYETLIAFFRKQMTEYCKIMD